MIVNDAISPLPAQDQATNGPIPIWNADRRELRFDGHLVKRFKHCSHNQEMVLAVFQEEAWVERINDPLSPDGEVDPKRRLNDTIKGLNHHQENRLIRFRGDGTGEGVTWETVPRATVLADVGALTDTALTDTD